MSEKSVKRIFVTGHRNPDIDSLSAAYALAELRRRQGIAEVTPVCPGILPDRARFLFERFHLTPPEPRFDVYLRAKDIMDCSVETIVQGTPLLNAVQILNRNGNFSRLPVVAENNQFLGMLSPLNLLSRLLNIGNNAKDKSLTGRKIHSSIDLISRVISAEALTLFEPKKIQDFQVYVAAMGVESFDSHLPEKNPRELALISGDRPEIHLLALQRKIRLMIVTGEKSVEPLILEEARNRQVTILKTPLDSASVIRQLKFSIPVEDFGFGDDNFVLNCNDRLHGLENRIMSHPEDVIPVVDENNCYAGIICKKDISSPPPYQLILVDHNEPEQSIPGIEEIPVIEVVDHHRIGMLPTVEPIKFTGDVVGSTCTLVAAMFRSNGESLTPELAGLLLGGLITDTLNLKSPTTAPMDHRICEWLEKISGIKAADLMAELAAIDSPLAAKSPDEVIDSDRKTYNSNGYLFSLSQVEETNLELLHRRKVELTQSMQSRLQSENLHFIALLVTDAVRENSELLILGDNAVIDHLPYRRSENGLFKLPGVLSRKKQLLPQILAILSDLNRP